MASSISSGLKTEAAALFAGRNRINAVTLLTDGTNAGTVIVYDNATAASGTVLAKVRCTGAELIQHVIFENPVIAQNGIYADVTGTGAEYIVYFGG
jgi:hypothetical protein